MGKCVVIGVIVVVAVHMAVAVAVVWPMIVAHGSAMPIGTTLGAKGGMGDFKHRTQLVQHRLQHMIAPDDQMVRRNLAGRVAVADMPGQPGHRTADTHHILGGCAHLNPAPVCQFQTGPILQAGGLGQIHKERSAPISDQPLAPDHAGLIVQRHGIHGRARRRAMGPNGGKNAMGGGKVSAHDQYRK